MNLKWKKRVRWKEGIAGAGAHARQLSTLEAEVREVEFGVSHEGSKGKRAKAARAVEGIGMHFGHL